MALKSKFIQQFKFSENLEVFMENVPGKQDLALGNFLHTKLCNFF